jgi:hypothetical protein
MKKAILKLHRTLPYTKLVWSQILSRLSWRYSNNCKAMNMAAVRLNNFAAKSIQITQHNMNTLCRYFRHMVERTLPVPVWWELSSTTATNGGGDTIFLSRSRTFPELNSNNCKAMNMAAVRLNNFAAWLCFKMGGSYIKYPEISWDATGMFAKDGVHLSRLGNWPHQLCIW